jgi:hypothetical protein
VLTKSLNDMLAALRGSMYGGEHVEAYLLTAGLPEGLSAQPMANATNVCDYSGTHVSAVRK